MGDIFYHWMGIETPGLKGKYSIRVGNIWMILRRCRAPSLGRHSDQGLWGYFVGAALNSYA
jgi:hypothetical protein